MQSKTTNNASWLNEMRIMGLESSAGIRKADVQKFESYY